MRDSKLRNIIIALGLLLIIIIIGVLGFMIIENFSFVEALFMTVITMSTVGFNEVRPLDTSGMLFTSGLIIFSFGIFVYVVTLSTRFLVEGVFRNYYKDNKVKKRIKRLSGHVIVCGYGRNGKQTVLELMGHRQKFVILESNRDIAEEIREETDYLYIEGDATHEGILEAARIDKAAALISTLPNDADNLFVVITARQMNKELKIISRASEDKADFKLKRAGADNVIMPDKVGGQRMAKLVIQPDVVEFLEYIMLQGSDDVTLKELSCTNMAVCFTDRSIGELGIRNITGANIIGLKKGGKYVFNPSPDTMLSSSDFLFVLGKPSQISKLQNVLIKGDV